MNKNIQAILDSILKLSKEDRKQLSKEVHTTTKGKQAFIAFVYGGGEAPKVVVEARTEEPEL